MSISDQALRSAEYTSLVNSCGLNNKYLLFETASPAPTREWSRTTTNLYFPSNDVSTKELNTINKNIKKNLNSLTLQYNSSNNGPGYSPKLGRNMQLNSFVKGSKNKNLMSSPGYYSFKIGNIYYPVDRELFIFITNYFGEKPKSLNELQNYIKIYKNINSKNDSLSLGSNLLSGYKIRRIYPTGNNKFPIGSKSIEIYKKNFNSPFMIGDDVDLSIKKILPHKKFVNGIEFSFISPASNLFQGLDISINAQNAKYLKIITDTSCDYTTNIEDLIPYIALSQIRVGKRNSATYYGQTLFDSESNYWELTPEKLTLSSIFNLVYFRPTNSAAYGGRLMDRLYLICAIPINDVCLNSIQKKIKNSSININNLRNILIQKGNIFLIPVEPFSSKNSNFSPFSQISALNYAPRTKGMIIEQVKRFDASTILNFSQKIKKKLFLKKNGFTFGIEGFGYIILPKISNFNLNFNDNYFDENIYNNLNDDISINSDYFNYL
tara:strand:+ start:4651 stop:6129 length:1479 start_codon:yes stop_codon:yes gene_type:complete